MSLKDALHWLRRARSRWYDALFAIRHVEQEKGESWAHYKARRDTLRHREEHRERIKNQLAKKVEWLRDHQEPNPPPSSEIGTWDGRQVAGWMVGAAPGPGGNRVNWLQRIEDTGKWGGGLYSGYRSPAYSTQLCMNICGQSSCPGLCAGAASNHSGLTYPGGAIDVADWGGFASGNSQVGGPFRNYLPSDRPHRSVSGY